MQALVIGAGKVGSVVAKGIAEREGVSRVIVGDKNVEGAKQVVNQIGKKAEAVYLNVDDRTTTLNLMRKVDIVLSMIGPGQQYAVPVLQDALEARRNLLDIADDAEPIPDLLAYDNAAKDAGLTMITGMGVSPGLSNLWARYGADKLDQVEEIRILWVCDMTSNPGAAWAHRLSAFSAQVPIFDAGQFTYVPGGTGDEAVEWPQPAGTVTERFFSHSEPLTIPRYIKKGLKHVSVKGAFTPEENNKFLMHLTSLALTSDTPVKVGDISIAPKQFMHNFLGSDVFKATDFYKDLIARRNAIGKNMGLRVIVKGIKDGKATQIVYELFGSDRELSTGTPAWVVAHMVLTGKIQTKGVLSPETLGLEPKPILDELAKEGATFKETIK